MWLIRAVQNLSFNRDVLVFNIFSLNWHIVNISFWNYLWYVTSDMLDSIVVGRNNLPWDNIDPDNISIVGDCPLPGDNTISWLIHIIKYFFLNRDILNSGLPFNHLSFNPLFYI